MELRKFQTVALSRDLRKCLSLRADTFLDKRWRYRTSACWARASPSANRFGRTTSSAPSFSSARSTIDIREKLHREIAAPTRQSCGHVAPEWDAFQQTMHNPGAAPALPP